MAAAATVSTAGMQANMKPPHPEKKQEERETWGNKIDFLLACIGFSVGLGNVWRFPYLCYKNGGGAFLIPYFICVVVGGIPLFFLEVALGQFMGVGGIKTWKICPLFEGIGWATMAIVFFVNCYYNIILTWAFYYLFASFTSHLPWDSCDNEWNTPDCVADFKAHRLAILGNGTAGANATNITDGVTDFLNGPLVNSTNVTARHRMIDPTTEFWEYKVLGISDGIGNLGTVKWDLALCLLLAWLVVYFCIWKGIKTSGKVLYVTATLPYVFMLILLIRGLTLPGAVDGIIFYLVPDFSKLLEIQVWVDAGTQIFFSYAIALGGLTALGSYNKFNHNSFKDALIFAGTNSGTSVLAGFVIFSILGFMAKENGVDISEVAETGPGLAFVAYPKAVSQMPAAPFWSIMFFFMIILLGLDSQFVAVEGLITAFQDVFPVLRKRHLRELFIAAVCFAKFLVGLCMVTRGGMYVFQLFDYYPASRIILLVGFVECIVVAYFYGVRRFYDNLEMMFGFRLNPYMMICWLALSPLYCIVIFIMSIVTYSHLKYERPTMTYTYPQWGIVLGWMLATATVIWIPLVAAYKIIMCLIKKKPIRDLLKPEGLKSHQLRSQDKPFGLLETKTPGGEGLA